MGYRRPNIDRVANEGAAFIDYYSQQSCTAGRACVICGQNPLRTGLTKTNSGQDAAKFTAVALARTSADAVDKIQAAAK
jgi:arylsulfatase A-like enzyme